MRRITAILIMIFLVIGTGHFLMAAAPHLGHQMASYSVSCEAGSDLCVSKKTHTGASNGSCLDYCLKSKGLGLTEAILPAAFASTLLGLALFLIIFLSELLERAGSRFGLSISKILFHSRLSAVVLRN